MVCPEMGHESVAFMGVFDGTVGSFAADFVHAHIAATLIEAQVRLRAAPRPTLVRPGSRPSTAGCAHSHGALMPAASYRSQDFPALQRAEAAPFERLRRLSESVLRETFAAVDKALLRACEERGGLGYASSTGVVALVAHGVLTLAHVGDSKVRGSCAWRGRADAEAVPLTDPPLPHRLFSRRRYRPKSPCAPRRSPWTTSPTRRPSCAESSGCVLHAKSEPALRLHAPLTRLRLLPPCRPGAASRTCTGASPSSGAETSRSGRRWASGPCSSITRARSAGRT